MSKKRCETCKYWEDAQEVDRVWGATPKKVGYCRRAGSEDGRVKDKDTMMVALDYEGYSAWLATVPGFSCAMWEKREEGDNEGATDES